MKANVLPIISDHLKTMTDSRTQKVMWSDIVWFYGVPLVAGAAAIILKWKLAALDNILAALALMAGLLFNLLILLFDTAVRIRDGTGDLASHRRELVRQIQATVTYALFISLVAAGVLGILSMSGAAKVKLPWSALVVFLLLHFVFLLGMILRRIRALFVGEFGK